MRAGSVTIGRFEIDMETAVRWVDRYTNAAANVDSDKPYAYPAYDRFNAAHNEPGVLLDADLLAPGLLNVPIAVRSFYGLQRIRGHLEAVLSRDELALPIVDLADDQVAASIGSLYAVLDDPGTKPWGVNGTTLSKVLHRKRPSSIALHDRWVEACYLGDGGPVPRAKSRTWAEYMSSVSRAMATDLRSHVNEFLRLQQASNASPPLSDLRLLDILAWHVGQRKASSPS